MQTRSSALLLALAGISVASAVPAQVASQAVGTVAAAEAAPASDSVLVGKVTREEVEKAVPEWTLSEAKAVPDPAAVRALGKVAPGATITVYLGIWCGDSRRELSRLWRTVDQMGEMGGTFPAAIELIGVDETKREPQDLLAGVDLAFVPTIVVSRGGKEVGRIVESSPHGIEVDLLDLLEGRAQGVLSLRSDLAPESPKP